MIKLKTYTTVKLKILLEPVQITFIVDISLENHVENLKIENEEYDQVYFCCCCCLRQGLTI